STPASTASSARPTAAAPSGSPGWRTTRAAWPAPASRTTGRPSSSGVSDPAPAGPGRMTVHGTAGPAREWVRSYAARRGRRSALTVERIERFLPERRMPDGPLDQLATFGRVAPLVLEIGCGHGAAAVAYCRTHPDHDLVAVDVHTPGIARML